MPRSSVGRPTIRSRDRRYSLSVQGRLQFDAASYVQDEAGPLSTDWRRGSIDGGRENIAATDLSSGIEFPTRPARHRRRVGAEFPLSLVARVRRHRGGNKPAHARSLAELYRPGTLDDQGRRFPSARQSRRLVKFRRHSVPGARHTRPTFASACRFRRSRLRGTDRQQTALVRGFPLHGIDVRRRKRASMSRSASSAARLCSLSRARTSMFISESMEAT